MDSTFTGLANDLRTATDEIVDRWRRLCEDDPALEVVDRLTHAEFRDGIPSAIESLCRALTQNSVEAVAEDIHYEAGRHGHHRWKQGFNLAQVLRDWGRLNQVLLRVMGEYFDRQPAIRSAHRIDALETLAQFMTEATSGSIRRFDELRRVEAATVTQDMQVMKERFDALTEARGMLLREATHDIRGSLSAVAMASRVLKLSAQSNPSLTTILDTLDRGVESVRDMLNSLLDLSRLESGAEQVELRSVDISGLLMELAAEHQPAASERGLALTTSGADGIQVRTDPGKVRRIAQNLILNALEHTSTGEVRVSWTLEESRWLMRVADTGPGMRDASGSPVARQLAATEPQAEPVVPEPESDYRGEGIGLTIVARLCSLLKAGLSVESELGRGTTFTVEFPVIPDEVPAAADLE